MKYNSFFLSFVLLSFLSFNGQAQEELSIPRFVSLKLGEVNLRTGPGNRFPIKYVYKEKNYPVEVIDEYELWRQIREIDGTVGWVHRRMLAGTRYIIMTKDDKLFKEPDMGSKMVAFAQKGTIARVENCPPQSNYCELFFLFKERKIRGWAHKDSFYGVYPNEVIK